MVVLSIILFLFLLIVAKIQNTIRVFNAMPVEHKILDLRRLRVAPRSSRCRRGDWSTFNSTETAADYDGAMFAVHPLVVEGLNTEAKVTASAISVEEKLAEMKCALRAAEKQGGYDQETLGTLEDSVAAGERSRSTASWRVGSLTKTAEGVPIVDYIVVDGGRRYETAMVMSEASGNFLVSVLVIGTSEIHETSLARAFEYQLRAENVDGLSNGDVVHCVREYVLRAAPRLNKDSPLTKVTQDFLTSLKYDAAKRKIRGWKDLPAVVALALKSLDPAVGFLVHSVFTCGEEIDGQAAAASVSSPLMNLARPTIMREALTSCEDMVRKPGWQGMGDSDSKVLMMSCFLRLQKRLGTGDLVTSGKVDILLFSRVIRSALFSVLKLVPPGLRGPLSRELTQIVAIGTVGEANPAVPDLCVKRLGKQSYVLFLPPNSCPSPELLALWQQAFTSDGNILGHVICPEVTKENSLLFANQCLLAQKSFIEKEITGDTRTKCGKINAGLVLNGNGTVAASSEEQVLCDVAESNDFLNLKVRIIKDSIQTLPFPNLDALYKDAERFLARHATLGSKICAAIREEKANEERAKLAALDATAAANISSQKDSTPSPPPPPPKPSRKRPRTTKHAPADKDVVADGDQPPAQRRGGGRMTARKLSKEDTDRDLRLRLMARIQRETAYQERRSYRRKQLHEAPPMDMGRTNVPENTLSLCSVAEYNTRRLQQPLTFPLADHPHGDVGASRCAYFVSRPMAKAVAVALDKRLVQPENRKLLSVDVYKEVRPIEAVMPGKDVETVMRLRKHELDLTGRTVCYGVLGAILGDSVEDELVGIGRSMDDFLKALVSQTPYRTNTSNPPGEGWQPLGGHVWISIVNDRPALPPADIAAAPGGNGAASKSLSEVKKRGKGRGMLSVHAHDFLEESEPEMFRAKMVLDLLLGKLGDLVLPLPDRISMKAFGSRILFTEPPTATRAGQVCCHQINEGGDRATTTPRHCRLRLRRETAPGDGRVRTA